MQLLGNVQIIVSDSNAQQTEGCAKLSHLGWSLFLCCEDRGVQESKARKTFVLELSESF